MAENRFAPQRPVTLAKKVQGSVDAVLCTAPENIYYFSGFRTTLYTRFIGVLIRLDRPEAPVLVVSTIDKRMIEERLWSPPWIADIAYHGPDQLAGISPTPAAALKPHLAGIGRIGVDSLRLAEVDILEQAAPEIEIVQIASLIDEGKLKKDEQELEFLQQANQLAMKGMTKVLGMLEADSITELEIAVRLEADARLAGADGFGYPTLVSSGAKMAAIHSPSLPRQVASNQPLRVAFGPAVQGYTADIVRTFCRGTPSAELIRLQNGYLAAWEALLKRIRPGAKVADLLSEVELIYTQLGVRRLWRNSIGHGVGMTVHEPPRLAAGSPVILSEGMVLAIEPFLVDPTFGGYAQCDVVLVRDSSPQVLAEGPQGILRV